MSSEPFGFIWLLVVFGGVIVLAAAYAYATYQWRHRSPAEERVSETATRRNYEAEEAERRATEEAQRLKRSKER